MKKVLGCIVATVLLLCMVTGCAGVSSEPEQVDEVKTFVERYNNYYVGAHDLRIDDSDITTGGISIKDPGGFSLEVDAYDGKISTVSIEGFHTQLTDDGLSRMVEVANRALYGVGCDSASVALSRIGINDSALVGEYEVQIYSNLNVIGYLFYRQ